jgi:putative transposase
LRRSVEFAQYVALVCGRRLREAGIARSMGSKATATTTPSARASTPRSRRSCSAGARSHPRQEAGTTIFDWIEAWYNRERRHSRLGYRSPANFEHDHDESSDCAAGTDEEIFIEEQQRAA